MQQGIKKLQWFEYFKVIFLEILKAGLCRVFANQVTYVGIGDLVHMLDRLRQLLKLKYSVLQDIISKLYV